MQRLLVFAALAGSVVAPAATWDIDPAHTSAQFKVRHLMISNVRGEFSKVAGAIDFDPNNLATARINAVIDAASLNTREPKRDAHLRSPDFFDVAKYPTIAFQSKKIVRTGKDHYQATGDLTIHGITREVTLDIVATPEIQDPWGNTRIGATATTKVNRKDFGLTWNQTLNTGGVLIGEEVEIALDVELLKKGVKPTD